MLMSVATRPKDAGGPQLDGDLREEEEAVDASDAHVPATTLLDEIGPAFGRLFADDSVDSTEREPLGPGGLRELEVLGQTAKVPGTLFSTSPLIIRNEPCTPNTGLLMMLPCSENLASSSPTLMQSATAKNQFLQYVSSFRCR